MSTSRGVANLFNADLYYIYFPQDPRLLKTVVYLVYVTETVYTILLVYDLGRIFFTFPEKAFLSILIPVCGAIGASERLQVTKDNFFEHL
jgi:hypothetical protein